MPIIVFLGEVSQGTQTGKKRPVPVLSPSSEGAVASPGSGIRASGSSCIKNPDLGVAGVGQGMRGWGNPSAHPLLGEGAARRGC